MLSHIAGRSSPAARRAPSMTVATPVQVQIGLTRWYFGLHHLISCTLQLKIHGRNRRPVCHSSEFRAASMVSLPFTAISIAPHCFKNISWRSNLIVKSSSTRKAFIAASYELREAFANLIASFKQLTCFFSSTSPDATAWKSPARPNFSNS
jgi:hypothetical protein